jgi:hypothetical protein
MQKRQVPGRFVHVSISETNTERPAICGKLVYRVPDLKTKARFIEPMLLQRAEELPQGWSWMYQLNDAEVRNINAIAWEKDVRVFAFLFQRRIFGETPARVLHAVGSGGFVSIELIKPAGYFYKVFTTPQSPGKTPAVALLQEGTWDRFGRTQASFSLTLTSIYLSISSSRW